MGKKIEKQKFFMECTLRICSSLEIERALWNCFDFMKNYIPADDICLQRYSVERGATHILAAADKNGGRLMDSFITHTPEVVELIKKGGFPQTIIANTADEHFVYANMLRQMGRSRVSAMFLRLEVEGRWSGGVTLWANGWDRFTEEHLNLLLCLRRPFTIALSNYNRYRALVELKNILADDKNYFQHQLQMHAGNEVVGADFGLKGVMDMVQRVATLDSPVMLRGETGTGKEVIASVIHHLSTRRSGPFIPVNCGAIPDSLMDSELFGHEKGAFTGASERKRGRFERAHRGTLFLDEIGELSLSSQVRLLRVLQDKKIERVGGSDLIDVDVRIIAATHRNLEIMMQKGQFREDLYFRLQVFPIIIPPLRHRLMDIPALVHHFLTKKSRVLGFEKTPELLPGVLEKLNAYHWPGNVRELENMIERALILHPRGPVEFDDMSLILTNNEAKKEMPAQPESLSFEQLVSKHIQYVLDVTGGKINGKNGAAELLGLNVSTLRQKMRKLNIPFGRKVYKKTP